MTGENGTGCPASLDRATAQPESLLGKRSAGDPLKPFQAASAVHGAKPSRCPRHAGFWAISLGEEPTASAIRCKSRRCSWCGRFIQLASYALIADGIAKAQAEGRRVRFMTLTDTAAGQGTVASFYSSWHRLTQRLKRRGKLGATARVLETCLLYTSDAADE